MVLEVVGTATDLQVHGLTQQLGQSVSRQHHGGWEEAWTEEGGAQIVAPQWQ